MPQSRASVTSPVNSPANHSEIHPVNPEVKGNTICLTNFAPPTWENKYMNSGFIPIIEKSQTPLRSLSMSIIQ